MASLFTRTTLTPGLPNRGQTSKGECDVYLAANSSDLHSLALLLTGDPETAALCVARAYRAGTREPASCFATGWTAGRCAP
jgi:hypothetical protein